MSYLIQKALLKEKYIFSSSTFSTKKKKKDIDKSKKTKKKQFWFESHFNIIPLCDIDNDIGYTINCRIQNIFE